ncbi:hypothetical protein POKO110462_17140 [Pontibacter korlensis]
MERQGTPDGTPESNKKRQYGKAALFLLLVFRVPKKRDSL